MTFLLGLWTYWAYGAYWAYWAYGSYWTYLLYLLYLPIGLIAILLNTQHCLELLSEDEVEVAAATGVIGAGTVETVSPVDTHQTDHRQEDTHTQAC